MVWSAGQLELRDDDYRITRDRSSYEKTAELKTINVPNRRNRRGFSLYAVVGDQIRSEHGSGRI